MHHDGGALGVDGGEIGVLEEADRALCLRVAPLA
jgi:hypothetical protein